MSDNENDTNLSFDSLSPGFNDHLRKFLEKYDCPATSPNGTETQWGSSSDPSIEGAILGLVDPDSSYNNPFQLTDEIRKEVVRRTASSGERALDWSLNSFDMVGGENTLRSVWAKLKSKHRVKGNKRAAENHDSTSDDDIKRCKRSLNISSTCIDLGNINIQTSSSSEGASLIKCMSPNEDIEVLRESCEIGMVECGGDSECSREYLGSNEFSSSDSIPGLTSSESSPLSSDSGRSDTWAGSNGIWGERNAKRSDIMHGIVTETERNPSVVEGFETDDVVEYDTSNDVYQGIAAYVSSTTDEGVFVGELETVYNDDVVLDLNTSHEMVEHVSASERGASRHGMPSIAESEAIDSSADELIDTSHGRLSIASSLWGGFGYVQSDASDVDSDHGEPSIAGYQWFEPEPVRSEVDTVDGIVNSHGRLSIAELPRGGQCDTTDVNGTRDSTCGEEVGGGAQPFQWQKLDPSLRMDNGEHDEEGKGGEGQEDVGVKEDGCYGRTDGPEGQTYAGDCEGV